MSHHYSHNPDHVLDNEQQGNMILVHSDESVHMFLAQATQFQDINSFETAILGKKAWNSRGKIFI